MQCIEAHYSIVGQGLWVTAKRGEREVPPLGIRGLAMLLSEVLHTG